MLVDTLTKLFHLTEKDLEDIPKMYSIDVSILGEEYREKDFTGKDICPRKRY